MSPAAMRRRAPTVPAAARPAPALPGGMAALDDPEASLFTIGQAAAVLDVSVPMLRRAEAAGALQPDRSDGRHRRYSRRELTAARRLFDLVSEGFPLPAAARIAVLERQVADLQADLARARRPRKLNDR